MPQQEKPLFVLKTTEKDSKVTASKKEQRTDEKAQADRVSYTFSRRYSFDDNGGGYEGL